MSSGGGGLQSMADVNHGKAKLDGPDDSSGSAPGMQLMQGDASGKELVMHGMWQPEAPVDEDEVLEFSIDEEVAQGVVKFLTMARYYSGKKYSARGLFEETKVA
jgi:hypothetical protein